MCATYRIFTDEENEEIRRIIEEVSRKTASEKIPAMFEKDSYPGGLAPIRRTEDGLVPATWGFPMKGSRSVVFNARGETLPEKYMFKYRLSEGRCLIPATGFYEWDKRDERKKIRLLIRPVKPSKSGLFYLAGLWKDCGAPQPCFTMVTTAPNDQICPIHNRMPAILPPGEEEAWLDPRAELPEVLRLLAPYEGDLLMAAG